MESDESKFVRNTVNIKESQSYREGKIITGLAKYLQDSGFETRGPCKGEVTRDDRKIEIYDPSKKGECHPTYHIGTAEFDSKRERVLIEVYGKDYADKLSQVMLKFPNGTEKPIDSIELILESEEPRIGLSKSLLDKAKVLALIEKFSGFLRRKKRARKKQLKF